MTFRSLKLIDPLLRALDDLGYDEPTPVQQQAIPAVLAGRDLMAAAQTGTGKTAGFALPLLNRLTLEGAVAPLGVRCLVLAPTRELAEQVFNSFRKYGAHVPLRFGVAYGGVPIEPQVNKLKKGLDVLVATPGRLLDLQRQGALTFAQLQTLVLDEADRMLDLGFAADLDAVFAALPPDRQTLLFSATFPEAIRALAGRLLRDPLSVQASPANAAARTVRQLAITTDKKSKSELFLHLLRERGWSQVLVFAKTRKGVDQLVNLLQREGVRADAIHGDKPQPARLRALARFKARDVDVLVATDVAARGLDIAGLPLVVNHDLPTVAEDYVHRIGRTGRAGATGEAISLVCADEVDLLKAIETLTRQVLPREEVPGFEADHRVPSTGTPARARQPAASKAASKASSKHESKPHSKPHSKPQSTPRSKVASAPKAAAMPAATPAAMPRPAGGSGADAPRRATPSQRVPQGTVVVAAGRGAKSAAKAVAKSAAQAPNKGPERGRRKR